MIRASAVYASWTGMALLVVGWLGIAMIAAISDLLWLAVMVAAAALCLYGGIRYRRLFLIPAIVAIVVIVGVVVASGY